MKGLIAMEGKQLSFSLNMLDPCSPCIEESPEILLNEGDVVYVVNKGDFARYQATGETWKYGKNPAMGRSYQLVGENGLYHITTNESIAMGNTVMDYDAARKLSQKYLLEHDVIMADSINPISVKAYSYIRKSDSRELIAFICDLGNETYYVKEFYTYHHIVKGKKTVKKFMEQSEFQNEKTKELSDFVPVFKNMYKCTEISSWAYGESEYTYATG